ncbi:MAG TPA: hypothetical protein VIQ54_06035 [Polyangia bacterium]|jgi:tetratricopeptide (TPR) repeat protein
MTVRGLTLVALTALALGCSKAPRDGEGPWIAEAARRHALADERLAAGDRPAARAELLAVVGASVPTDVPDADSRGVLQDTYFRLAKLDLDARDPRAALADTDLGLSYGKPADLFVANLLIARGAAHEALGNAPAAAEAYHQALAINDRLLAETLGDKADDVPGEAP